MRKWLRGSRGWEKIRSEKKSFFLFFYKGGGVVSVENIHPWATVKYRVRKSGWTIAGVYYRREILQQIYYRGNRDEQGQTVHKTKQKFKKADKLDSGCLYH